MWELKAEEKMHPEVIKENINECISEKINETEISPENIKSCKRSVKEESVHSEEKILQQMENRIQEIERKMCKVKKERKEILSRNYTNSNSSNQHILKCIEKCIAYVSRKRKILLKCSNPEEKQTPQYQKKFKRLENKLKKLCQIKRDLNKKKRLNPSIYTPCNPPNNNSINRSSKSPAPTCKDESNEKPIEGDQLDSETKKKEVDNVEVVDPDVEMHKNLKRNFDELLANFCKLGEELEKVRKICDKKTDYEELNEAENVICKEELTKLQEERKGLGYIFNEQSYQLEEQKMEYLKAKQIIAEQNCKMNQLKIIRTRIQKTAKKKVQKMKKKFQKKVIKLVNISKLLERERRKFAQCCTEKRELKRKLKAVCEGLKPMKAKLTEVKMGDSLLYETGRKEDSKNTKNMCEMIEEEKDMLMNELQRVKDELNTFRLETSEIISTSKQNARLLQRKMKKTIRQLKEELIYCREHAAITTAQYTRVMHNLQFRLQDVTYKFQAAQAEIDTLKNHITCLNGEVLTQVTCANHGLINFE